MLPNPQETSQYVQFIQNGVADSYIYRNSIQKKIIARN